MKSYPIHLNPISCNRRLIDRAAILSKKSSQYNFFSSNIGGPSEGRSNVIKYLAQGRKIMLDSVFFDVDRNRLIKKEDKHCVKKPIFTIGSLS